MDPYLAYKEGGLVAVAVILFIANFVQNFSIKKTNDALLKEVREANQAHAAARQGMAEKAMLLSQTIADGQNRTFSDLKEVIKNQERFEALSAGQAEILAAVIKNQDVLGTNLVNLTHTNSEVIRELITIIRGSERS